MPASDCDLAPAADRRGVDRVRRVRRAALFALVGRGVAIGVTLVTVPLTLGYLGAERYGYWVALQSVALFVSLADFGLGYGLLNRVAAACGADDQARARTLISNASLLLTGVAGGGLLLSAAAGIGLWQFSPAGPDAVVFRDYGPAALTLAVGLLAGLPLATWQRAAAAAQEGYLPPCFDALGSGLALGLLVAVMACEGGLVALAAATVAGPLLAAAGGWAWFFLVRMPAWRPRVADWNSAEIRGLLGEGAGYFVLQVSALALVSGSGLVVLRRCGPVELAAYTLVAKPFQLGPQLAAFWFAPLWPAYGEALARGDVAWAQRAVRRATWLIGGATALGGLVLVACSADLVRWWTGAVVNPTVSLRVALALTMVLGVATTSVSTFLNASGCLRAQAWLAVLQLALSLPLGWWLAGPWGEAGVAWGVALGYAFVVVPMQAWLVPRVLGRQRERAGGEAT